jgi:hypothetical protein
MMLAAAGGDANLAHLIRNHGGDQNAVDWLRRTASDHAKVAGHRDPFLGPQ